MVSFFLWIHQSINLVLNCLRCPFFQLFFHKIYFSLKFREVPSELFNICLHSCCSWRFSMKAHLLHYPSSLKNHKIILCLSLSVVVLVAVSLSMCLCESVGSYIHLPLCGCVCCLIPSFVSFLSSLEEAWKGTWILQIQNLSHIQGYLEGYFPHLSCDELHIILGIMLMSWQPVVN